ncbi:MAG: oxidoreductase [Deltaproteobacteria bacterium CG2_30_63_29]|nr:MAG: oxidoreductase [Deltaproteobacteria bacterium CG2_30_63_29]PJB36630.1 MAG: oxidoreductase [Deltaproteobacteria bacterium CG_4_9_14_3_um_filter_63_12]
MSAGHFLIGGELEVRRLGFGAMRVCGPGVWGPPADRASALQLLRHVVKSGVNLIDTADAYGPDVSEELIAEALYPYPKDLVIATKGGLTRQGPGQWLSDGRPEYLRKAIEGSLRRLRTDCIDLYQLHAVDDEVPIEDSIGELAAAQRRGEIRSIGVSNVTAVQLVQAQAEATIVTVQNKYNLTTRKSDEVLDYCAELGIGFIPWFPLDTGRLATADGVLSLIARAHDATTAQVALAWLLARAPVVLPIPGTSSIAHFDENEGANRVELNKEEMQALSGLDQAR